jgi:CBS-domain-containing membrane protein
MSDLDRLNAKQRASIDRLTVVQGGRMNYVDNIFMIYLEKLNKLKYVEVTNTAKELVALVPIQRFKDGRTYDHYVVSEFIQSLGDPNEFNRFVGMSALETVPAERDMLDTLRYATAKSLKELAVVGEGKLIGIVKTKDIEARIIDEVLKAKQSA